LALCACRFAFRADNVHRIFAVPEENFERFSALPAFEFVNGHVDASFLTDQLPVLQNCEEDGSIILSLEVTKKDLESQGRSEHYLLIASSMSEILFNLRLQKQ
jgi:hypothetical protein